MIAKMKSMLRVAYPLPFLQRVGASGQLSFIDQALLLSFVSSPPAPTPSLLPHSIKILFFAASARDLFVRQLYRAERFFPAIENCGGVCEEEASKEEHHKKG
jgi:hypothetical protein